MCQDVAMGCMTCIMAHDAHSRRVQALAVGHWSMIYRYFNETFVQCIEFFH